MLEGWINYYHLWEENKQWKYLLKKIKLFSVFILDEPSAFYAEEIYDSTEGLGTNDEKLQRIFIQRSEVGGLCQYNIYAVWQEFFDQLNILGGPSEHWQCLQEHVQQEAGEGGEGGDWGTL